jgi:hypothetical protein
VVAGGVDENLRLALQAPEGLGVEDAIAVALVGGANGAFRLGLDPSPREGALGGLGGEELKLEGLLLFPQEEFSSGGYLVLQGVPSDSERYRKTA